MAASLLFESGLGEGKKRNGNRGLGTIKVVKCSSQADSLRAPEQNGAAEEQGKATRGKIETHPVKYSHTNGCMDGRTEVVNYRKKLSDPELSCVSLTYRMRRRQSIT